MVRVGGGWAALDEFLVKNDPCRARGRTNVELREQFTLAAGISQNMTPFKARASVSGASPDSSSTGRLSMSGPITKIKEKSERSLPMARKPSFEMSGNSEGAMGYSPRRPSALAGNRTGSKPPSRTGSNVSLNSDDYSGMGSGVRRSSSMKSGMAGPLGRVSGPPAPIGFGSSTPRRTSSPYTNGRTPSNSSADRVPMGNRNRTASMPRSESGLSGSDLIRRSSKTTTSTSFAPDGSRITKSSTTTKK